MKYTLPLDGEFFHEPLPDEIVAAMERNERAIKCLAKAHNIVPSYFVQHTKRWLPGSTVKVAFKGGTTELRERIQDAVTVITDEANLSFNFQNDDDEFYEWTVKDTTHQGDIRICFDRSGYWSLVGTDATNTRVVTRDRSIGGIPGGRTMCFGGFEERTPTDFNRIVVHEFMHAIGFQHEHQSPNSNCDNAFRWDDDEGYQPTINNRNAYINDSMGRRPGVYTLMSGAPNFWPRAKVTSNMKPSSIPVHERTVGEFDPQSIMLYRFPANYYNPGSSDCQPVGNGMTLSAQDIVGLDILYPADEERIETILEFEQNASTLIAAKNSH